MKLRPELLPSDLDAPANEFALPQGIIGFPKYRRAELLYLPDHLPFLWMNLRGETPRDIVRFIVIEPGGVVPGYEPELYEVDVQSLVLTSAREAMILNIVTLQRENPVEATVNLIGPIVINRRTRVGRQVVIANHALHTTRHPLLENSQAPEVAVSR